MLRVHNRVDELKNNNHVINLKTVITLNWTKNVFYNATKESFTVVLGKEWATLQSDDRPWKRTTDLAKRTVDLTKAQLSVHVYPPSETTALAPTVLFLRKLYIHHFREPLLSMWELKEKLLSTWTSLFLTHHHRRL